MPDLVDALSAARPSKDGADAGLDSRIDAGADPRVDPRIDAGANPRIDPRIDAVLLARDIKRWGRELGFADIAITAVQPPGDDPQAQATEARLQDWLDRGYHGTMDYMARHGLKRARPGELVPGTLSVIAARMDYLPRDLDADNDAWIAASWAGLDTPGDAMVARYAHGRDYHRVLRGRLQKLADRIADAIGPFGHRVFTDSAPVMEVELAQRAGLGWRGKHTLLLSRDGGSMFFLGELFVDLRLPADEPVDDHCGSCTRCIDVCPTRAIVAPHVLDARRCISYLTIEHDGPIPEEFRAAIGNRIYGCDDCQTICPWNRFAQRSPLADFDTREHAHRTLLEVFAWSEDDFLRHTEGTAIRRIGHERWLRNVAVALGNALASGAPASNGPATRGPATNGPATNALGYGRLASDAPMPGLPASGRLASPPLDDGDRTAIRDALLARRADATPLVREHIDWALVRQPAG